MLSPRLCEIKKIRLWHKMEAVEAFSQRMPHKSIMEDKAKLSPNQNKN